MSTIKRVFGWMIKGLGVLTLLVIVAFALTNFFSRQEKELTRDFFEHMGEGNFEAAYALFHPVAHKDKTLQEFRTALRDIAVYNDFVFSNFKFSTNEGVTLSGQASTQQGCTSAFTIRFVDERIMRFDMSSVCFAEDRAT